MGGTLRATGLDEDRASGMAFTSGQAVALAVFWLVCGGLARAGSAVTSARAGTSSTLESRLKPIIVAHKGKVAVAVKHLDTGECSHFTTQR